jgi:histidinol phosphatase-like PHP family hydrolase
VPDDINAVVSFLLRDLAAVQSSRQKRFGYERAAAAVFWLDDPLTALWSNQGLSVRVHGIGPSSTRVIAEVVETGSSPTVEHAVDASGKRTDVAKRRALRSNFLSRAAVRRVLADSTLVGPTLTDYRGDLQMHSEWSDGLMTLAELIESCAGRGYEYAAVTDHSHGLKIARGMSMTDVAQQHRDIDRLNRELSGFQLLKGIEANIADDGSLDLSAHELGRFDVVLAAPHSKLRLLDDQTPRLIHAVEHPFTHILAHPRGRVAGTRAGIVADWDEVFGRAASVNVAVEIDGDPARQDLDHELASRALQAGCVFALDSDAHSPRELTYAETALAHARLAGIPPDRILNCWKLEWLRGWLSDRPTLRR